MPARTVLAVLCVCVARASAVVIGIDFGARFLKIAAIKPGSGIDMVFNEASKRKSSAAVAFNQEKERVLGDDAYGLGPRLPKQTYLYVKTLLGQGLDSRALSVLVEYGYPYQFVENGTTHSLALAPERGEAAYLVEELAAFILSYAKKISEAHVGSSVRDCVLTVPPFWKHSERLALLRAAEIANLNVLSLIHETTAVSFKYGFDKEPLFAEKPLTAVFYDLGAASLKVSVVEFSASVGKKNKTQGSMVVKGVAWDERVGGRDLDACVADYLIDEFVKKHPAQGATLRASPRGMAKIRKEAEKIKEILSANVEIPVAIEALHEDVDFRHVMHRKEFERRCEHVWPLFEPPVARALEQAGLTIADVDKVEIVGGATRVPRVKEVLKAYFKREQLDASLNGDEACALGAALYAAKMSTSFRLREFGITDYWPHAISVRMGGGGGGGADGFESADDEAGGGGGGGKDKVLFKPGSKFPHKKMLSVARTEDFVVDALVDGEPYAALNVTGVSAGIASVQTERREPAGKPKASLTFQLTSDGLLEIAKAEVMMDVMETYDEWVPVNDTAADAAGADGADAAADAAADEGGAAEGGDAAADAAADGGADAAAEGEGDAAAEGEASADGAAAAEDSAEEKPASKPAKGSKPKKEPKKKKQDVKKEKVTKTAKRVHHVALASSTTFTSAVQPINETIVKSCIARNKEMLAAEELRRLNAEAKNRVEAYILDTRDRLDSADHLSKVVTNKQKNELSKQLEKAEEWLYGDGMALPTDKYAAKEKELKELGEPVFFRLAELEARPAAVESAREKLKATRELVGTWAEEKPQISEEERSKTLELCDNITSWLDGVLKEQGKKQGHDEPAFTSEQVGKKLAPLDKAVRVLSKKPKPKPKPEPTNETEANATAAEGGEGAAEPTEGGAEGDAEGGAEGGADGAAAEEGTAEGGGAEGKKDEL